MLSRRLTRSIAAGAAALAVGIGAYAIGSSTGSSSATSGTATAAPAAQLAQATGGGQVPQGWRPGTGTIITGAAADKAKAAAVAKYPEGTVNRVLQLSDGSYAVHRIGISAHHHIFVSKDFTVTGTS
jgi:hypothetical protein